MKFRRGDLVGRMSAGGFGEWSQSARPAVVVSEKDGEYELYLPGYCPNRETVPEQFVDELAAEKKKQLTTKAEEVLAKLERFNLQDWDPNYEIREALRAMNEGGVS